MADDLLSINDNIVYYHRQTSLFNLHCFQFDDLLKALKENNSPLKFTQKSVDGLRIVFATIQKDAFVYHKQDFNISLQLSISYTGNVTLYLFADRAVMPCVSASNQFFFCEFDLKLLDDLESYTLIQKSYSYCMIDYKLLNFVKKIDLLLDYNGGLYNQIVKHGIYPEAVNIEDPLWDDLFNVDMAEDMFSVKSKIIKKMTRDSLATPFLDIDYYENYVCIQIAGQSINLNLSEFMAAQNEKILDILMNLLKMKNIPITCMSTLRDYLLIEHMQEI